ncbi:MAG: DMT family transporter [Nanoarchaeota archaeon]|nr:DMT family transporter [Nanoarchaeota archaeon]
MIITGFIFGIIAMLGWGIGDIILKKPAREMDSVEMNFYIQLFAFIIALPFFIIFVLKNPITISSSDIILVILVGVLDLFAYLNLFQAIKKGELSIVTPIAAVNSVITVILSVIFLKEVLGYSKIIAIIFALGGVVLVSTDLKKLKDFHTTAGVPNALICMFVWGVYLFLAGLIETHIGWLLTFFLTCFSVTFFSTLRYTFSRKKKKILSKKNGFKLFSVSSLYVGAWLFFMLGLSTSLVSIMSVLGSMAPLVTIVLARIIYKEKLVMNKKYGVFLILLGLVLINL